MFKKRTLGIFLFFFLFLTSCGKKDESVDKRKNSKNLQNLATKENIFSNNSIEKVIDTFSKKSKENRINIGNFEKLAFENKDYYYAKINSKSEAIYTLDYSGINATGIFLKVGKVDGANLGIIENMVANLIEVSDKNITDSEARAIYTKILANLGEKDLASSLTYSNGITYGIRINSSTSEFIFFAKESESENAVTSIQNFDFEMKEKDSPVVEVNLRKKSEN